LQDNGGPTFTMALAASSPVVDAGNNTFTTFVDQRGQPRVAGTAADIGGVELDTIFRGDFERCVQ
jgi:hypothetical protein